MDQPIRRARLDTTGTMLLFSCPGCGEVHGVRVGHPAGPPPGTAPHAGEGPLWDWNGDLVEVTLHPSVRVRWTTGEGESLVQHQCHLILRAGVAEFCQDCTHAMAGKQAELPVFSW